MPRLSVKIRPSSVALPSCLLSCHSCILWSPLRNYGSIAILLSLALASCGPAGPPIGKVSGTVTLDKQPLANAGIVFQPANGRPSYGMTDSAGQFTLEYSDGIPGALIGHHSVIIRTAVWGDFPGDPKATPEKLPKKYHDETELTADVESGNNTIDFDLTSSPGQKVTKSPPRSPS
jgi:hypothetical protein